MRKVIYSLMVAAWGVFWALSGLALGVEVDQAKILEGAKKEGRLVYYTSMTLSDSSLVVNKFEEKYPFIKTEVYRAGGDKLLNKILAEVRAKKYLADVCSAAINHTQPLKKEGYLEQYRSIELAAYPDNLKDPEGYWTSMYLMTHVLGYNTRMVSAGDAPKAYADLLAPKWKGKISMDMLDAEWFGGQLEIMGEKKGLEFMKKLAAQSPIFRNGHNLQTQLMAAGEFPIAVNLYGHSVESFKALGAPVEWIPIEPVVTSMHALAATSKGSHPNAARLFVDFVLSKEGQMLIRSFHRIPPRLDVAPDPPRLLKGFKLFPFGPSLGERINEFNQLYTEIFIKR